MPAKESAFDRFWRRERLTGKFKGAFRGARVFRSAKDRPDKSRHWQAVAEERLMAKVARRLAAPYARMRKALFEKERLTGKMDPIITGLRIAAYHEVLLYFLKAENLALEANIAETNYLMAVQREMDKGNIQAREDIQQKRKQLIANRVTESLKARPVMRENIESLKQAYGNRKAELKKQFSEVSRMIKKDPEYRRLYSEAFHLQRKLRQFKAETQGRAIIDLVMLELKIKEPQEANERQMLDTVAIAQLRANSTMSEIKVMNRYLEYLKEFGKEFAVLEKAIKRVRLRRETELGIYEKQLAEYNKWWYGKGTEQK